MVQYQNIHTQEVREIIKAEPLTGAQWVFDNGDRLTEKALKQDWRRLRRPPGEGTGLKPMWAFTPVVWEGGTAVGGDSNRLGLVFTTEGGEIIRITLGVENAHSLAESITEEITAHQRRTSGSHSEISSEIPSVQVSTPPADSE